MSINGTGIGCNISFNGSYIGMSFNSSSGLYYYNKSFADLRVRSYTQNYNVSCLGNTLGFENLSYSSSFDVELNATLLTLGQSLEGVYEGASLVLGDVNNDSMIDLIIGGTNGTRVLKIYLYNDSEFIFNESLEGYGAKDGSLGLIDYDKDVDLDIMQTGSSETAYESRVLEKD